MNRSGLLLSAALLLAAASLSCAAASVTSNFALTYSSPELSLSIHDGSVLFARRVYVYDNPVSATPSSVRIQTNSRPLAADELGALSACVRTNRFFDLETACGAPREERSYSYTVSVTLDSRTKSVTYRSNPAYPGPPEAFSRLEKLILSLK